MKTRLFGFFFAVVSVASLGFANPSTTIDVLVLYTPAVAAANGGNAGAEAVVAAAIADANTAYSNSGIDLALNLSHTQLVEYTESGSMNTDLSRLRAVGEGYLDDAHFLRAASGADSVCLFTHEQGGSYAGLAYVMSPVSSGFDSNAFSVILHNYAVGYHTFAHELGHNFGCVHARPESSGGGAFGYSFGHRFTGNDSNQYRTVMAYAPGQRIGYFSNPNVTYQGVATGVGGLADNALTINNSKATTAAFTDAFSNYSLGADDLFWQHTDGSMLAWNMSGLTRGDIHRIPKTVNSAWRVRGIADLNSDGEEDLVFRNSNTGKVLVWHMNGKLHDSTTQIGTVGTVWDLVGIADMNADSNKDFIWSNRNDGRLVVWLMNGTTRNSVSQIGQVGTAWSVCAVDDFNGDGKPDLLWRHNDGRLLAWYMDGVTRSSVSLLYAVNPEWTVVETIDLDGDSDSDILWRHTNGNLIVWLMNGSTRESVQSLYSVNPAWQSVGR